MELRWVITGLLIISCFELEAQDRSGSEENIVRTIYSALEHIVYPKVSKQDIKTGTCFVVISHDDEWSVSILNSLGIGYDTKIFKALGALPANNVQLSTQYIPITFVAGELEYARVQPPAKVLKEVRVKGLASYKNRTNKEKLLKDYNKQFRQGNYSKSLRVLDLLILLDPYRVNYRTERLMIYQLLGSPSTGCHDYIILTEIVGYEGVGQDPCSINGSN